MAEKQVGPYCFYEVLGRGSFASVFRCIDTRSGQTVAIKAIPLRRLDTSLQKYLSQEIDAMMKLQSEYIVKLLDVFKTNNNVYLVLEYCEGGNVHSFLQRSPTLPTPLLKRWLLTLVEAFIHLRAKHILHRDLKLENVLLTSLDPEEAVVKLADFGLTRILRNESFLLQSRVGSPMYMAPEIINGQPADGRVDVWSFGVLANFMMRGPLFNGVCNNSELIDAQKQAQATIATSSLPSDAKELLSAALTYDPQYRPWFDDLRKCSFFAGISPYPSVPFTQARTLTFDSLRIVPSLSSAGYTFIKELQSSPQSHFSLCQFSSTPTTPPSLFTIKQTRITALTTITREVSILRQVSSPYIVTLYDVFRDREYLYLVLEHCPGGSVQDYISANGPVSAETGKRWLSNVLEACVLLESKGIAHRGLSTKSVMVAGDGVKLGDFGVAREGVGDVMELTQLLLDVWATD